MHLFHKFILAWNLHVSDSSSVPHQEFIHCLQTCMTYTIAEFTVNKVLMMDRWTVRNM